MSARPAVAATVAFAAVATFVFGTLLSETLLLYPNIFADVPDSLALTMEFMAVIAPGDVLPPLGAASLLTGVAAVALTVRRAAVRWWEIAAVASLLFGQFIFSAAFFWPRNQIMFVEGAAVHDPAYLQQVAAEFQTGHWVRVGAGAVAATLAFVAMLRMHREAIAASRELGQNRPDTPT
ncbi:hypothetical protein BHQ18_22190 [Mycolicibacterium flavescens]|uniref:DUF1772 domain-containing protein n=1 Tax=Mycolicibacterium flavescens TaxID=1776 RepID=A0A1E3RD75_MYCFV|nr:hypothetical protein BHQ18_22190 [Mycolicibacterium flavescens]